VQEYKEVSRSKNQDTGITLVPSETNLYSWQAFLKVREGV
jgi:peroxin-4